MEPPIPIGSMYGIFTYTQVTFYGKSSQIYQSHQLSGLFFDPTLSSPLMGKNNLHNGFIQPSPKRQGRIGRMIFDGVQTLIPCGGNDDSKHPFFRPHVDARRLGVFWCLTGWWLNQPIWKICSWSWESSPNFRGENEKSLKPPPSWGLFEGGIVFSPLKFHLCKEDTKMTELSQLPFKNSKNLPVRILLWKMNRSNSSLGWPFSFS